MAIRQVSAAPVLTGSMLLALAPAGHALTLGEINVRSTLGQRLDATVPVRLGAGEALASACVLPGRQTSDLRFVPDVQVTTPQASREGEYQLQVTSAAPLYEPMYELELKVQCPGTPVLVRQYVLMLDLPASVSTGAAGVTPPLTSAVRTREAAAPDNDTASQAMQAQPPRPEVSRPAGKIQTGSTYRVMEGDTLSTIAQRVQGRGMSLKALAAAIQAANPQAFIRNDANLIKLGSDILIPATGVPEALTANSAAASPASPSAAAADAPAMPVAATTPAASPVAVVPTPVAPVVPETIEPAAAAPPAVAPAPVVVRPAARAAAPAPVVDSEPASADEPNPFFAAGAGIVFGLLVSTLLWFRGRLPARKRSVAASVPEPTEPKASAAAATMAVPLVTRPSEPGFSVSFTPANDDPLAAEFADEPEPQQYSPPPASTQRSPAVPAASEDITSELEELFDGTDTTIQKRLGAEKTMAARSFGGDADGYTPPDMDVGIDAGGTVDVLLDELANEDATVSSRTVDQPRPRLDPTDRTPTVDLRTLATSATKDQQQAQTLLEALTLLERDYEEELTASQVLDMSAVREALGNELDEPTQISDARLREVSARKKAR